LRPALVSPLTSCRGCNSITTSYCGYSEFQDSFLAVKDVVIDIYVIVNSGITLSKLGVNKANLKKQAKGEILDHTSYYDSKEGYSYTINDGEPDRVVDVTYLPSSKDCKQMIQRKSKKMN